MSLYLQIAVGDGTYLLDTAGIVEIRTHERDASDAVMWQDRAAAVVDLRTLFATAPDAGGCCVLFTQTSGEVAALVVDRVDGLSAFATAELAALPPIGPLGALIDAVSTRAGDVRPALRLRGERALAASEPA